VTTIDFAIFKNSTFFSVQEYTLTTAVMSLRTKLSKIDLYMPLDAFHIK